MSRFTTHFDNLNAINAVSIDWLYSVHPCVLLNTKTGRETWYIAQLRRRKVYTSSIICIDWKYFYFTFKLNIQYLLHVFTRQWFFPLVDDMSHIYHLGAAGQEYTMPLERKANPQNIENSQDITKYPISSISYRISFFVTTCTM